MKLYPETEEERPSCLCYRCYLEAGFLLRDHMFLCPTCGNKRCPHANDHREECSGSNDVGQDSEGNDEWVTSVVEKWKSSKNSF